jgi:hypothetical protein
VTGKTLHIPKVNFGASLSSQSLQRDATLTRLSFSTLQYGTSLLVGVSSCVSIVKKEFFM